MAVFNRWPVCYIPPMQIFHSLAKQRGASVVTIGMFDGVHNWHQKILRAAIRDARRMKANAIAITFERHPRDVIRWPSHVRLISTTSQKLQAFESIGLDRAVVVRFDAKFSRISPESFVKDYLLARLGMRELCVGYDFAFGRNREGNLALLKKLSGSLGFRLRIFSPSRSDHAIVSSTATRSLLVEAKLDEAKKLLGRFYSMDGTVERGRGIGKSLGYPTANIRMENDVLLPDGVYAVFVADVANGLRPGVLNVGLRPTFEHSGGPKKSWELHIWDFQKGLVGKRLQVHFVRRLRAERRFASPEALSAQIGRDVNKAKAILSRKTL